MRHLTGEQALDRVIEAVKAHHIRKGTPPTRVTLPYGLALHLIKLGSRWFGYELATKLWYQGPQAFTTQTLHGMQVTLGMSRKAKLKVT